MISVLYVESCANWVVSGGQVLVTEGPRRGRKSSSQRLMIWSVSNRSTGAYASLDDLRPACPMRGVCVSTTSTWKLRGLQK